MERRRHRLAALVLALPFVAAACAGTGQGLDDNGNPILPTLIHGWITDPQLKPVGPGVMFIEWGELWGGDYHWTTLVDENGYFARELPTAGQSAPQYGFHWYFPGSKYKYIPKPITLHPGQDNNINEVLFEGTSTDGLTALPADKGGWNISPEPTDDAMDTPMVGNPAVTPLGDGLVRLEIDAMAPKNPLSDQELVGDDLGDGIRMNAPGPVIDGGYPNGRYNVTMSLPPDAPDTVMFHFISNDHDCRNSDPLFVTAKVR